MVLGVKAYSARPHLYLFEKSSRFGTDPRGGSRLSNSANCSEFIPP